ncbi:MAG: hypothetical protein U0Q12_09220 [Vicinamibacterales bacterium]
MTRVYSKFWLGVAFAVVATAALGARATVTSAQAARPAGGYDAAFFASLKWRNIGPNRGGRSITAAGSASRPLEYYFGATGGGVWKTTDGGTTWNPVSDAAFTTSSSVGALAVAESNPDVLYVGMGETEFRGNVAQGDGVYKTADAGKTWTKVGLEKTQAISRIRIHPTNPDVVYVAALGDPYGPNAERGVFRSKDGGASWQRVLFRDEKTGAVDLVMDPGNPETLYAGLWEAYRTPHSLSSGGPGSGLFKTSDGGATWTELTRRPGMPTGIVGKIGVAVSAADSQRVYAIVEALDGGVFRSDDGGATWTKVNEERKLRQRAFYYSRIYADPKDRDTIYVLNTGVYRSTDGGKTYKSIRVPHGDNHDLWIASNDPKRMIEANDGSANVSVNGGETWTDQDVPTAQFYHVATTTHVPYHVCGSQQDNSSACVPSDGNGSYLYDVGGGESGYIAPSLTSPDVFFAGAYGGHHTRKDVRAKQERWINPWPEDVMGHASAERKERFQWTAPIVISKKDQALYHGSQHLWRSTNEGQTWTQVSGDLTRADPATLGPSGGPITLDMTGVETYGTIFSIAPSPLDANVIWTGSDDGVVHVTRDLGKTWDKVTPPDLPEFARISLIDASPHRAGAAYVAANRYQRSDRRPYVYKTEDFGKTWTSIVTDLPANDFARAIREDPKRPGLLYLGMENGIYVSFNDGANWQSLRLNLPVTPVHDVVVQGDDLVIATHGRSFWVMDDISVLRQLSPQVASASFHLFKPADATRSVSRGVAVDYYLKEKADAVKIEFLDAAGQVIRTVEGKPEPEGKGDAKSDEADFGPPKPPKVTLAAGMNRYVWDMRYEGAAEFDGQILWWTTTRGPEGAPGAYKVRVSVGNESKVQDFALLKNPNVPSMTDADYQEQFRLAKQVRDRFNQANEAVIWIRSMKKDIQDRADKAKDPKIASAAQALTARLEGIEGEIYQRKASAGQDVLNYGVRLNNKFGVLQVTVESADSKPTDQSYAVFKDLSARLDAQLSQLDNALSVELGSFNKLLAAKKLPAVDSSKGPGSKPASAPAPRP